MRFSRESGGGDKNTSQQRDDNKKLVLNKACGVLRGCALRYPSQPEEKYTQKRI
jgi:hypothetical protein